MKIPVIRTHARGLVTKFFSNPIAKILIALKISPNLITVIGFLVTSYSAYLIAQGDLVLGGSIMFIGAGMDMFDGAVARMAGRESVFGAFFDSVMDRLGEAMTLFGLLAYFVAEGDSNGIYLSFGALTVSMMVSYLRARAEGLSIPGDKGILGRPERVVVLGVTLIVGLPSWGLGIIVGFGLVTILQRGIHVWKNANR